jgi:hypothetical protein
MTNTRLFDLSSFSCPSFSCPPFFCDYENLSVKEEQAFRRLSLPRYLLPVVAFYFSCLLSLV